jgi:hypothetical protein
VSTGPQDPAAGRDRLRAGHADREQAIETLKTAFVDGRLTKNELAARTGRALAARTYANLAALTADIPAGAVEPAEPVAAVPAPAVPTPAEPAAAPPVPARPPAPPIRRPLAKAATVSGVCLIIATAARFGVERFDPAGPGPNPHHALGAACFLLGFVAIMVALFIIGLGVFISIEQRRSRRQLPPRPEHAVPVVDARSLLRCEVGAAEFVAEG